MADDSNPITGLIEALREKPGTTYGTVLPFAKDDASGDTSLALPSMVRQPLLDLLGLVSDTGTALSGKGMPAEALAPGKQAGQLFNLVGLGSAPEGALGMMTGMRSRTAPVDQLPRAEQYLSMGMKPNTVRQLTGWFLGPDGEWRHEISDDLASLKGIGPERVAPPPGTGVMGTGSDGMVRGDSPLLSTPFDNVTPNYYKRDTKLGDILDHPDLFAAYPEARNVPIGNVMGFGLLGSFNPESGMIRLAPQKHEDFLSTLLHETQHWVQNKEDFQGGASTDMFLPKDFGKTLEDSYTKRRNFETTLRDSGYEPLNLEYALLHGDKASKRSQGQLADLMAQNPKLFEKWKDAVLDHQKNVDQQNEAYATYTRVVGENEARNTQERMHLSPTERHELAPWDEPGYIPVGKQVIPKLSATPVPYEPEWASHTLIPVDHEPEFP